MGLNGTGQGRGCGVFHPLESDSAGVSDSLTPRGACTQAESGPTGFEIRSSGAWDPMESDPAGSETQWNQILRVPHPMEQGTVFKVQYVIISTTNLCRQNLWVEPGTHMGLIRNPQSRATVYLSKDSIIWRRIKGAVK